MQAIRVHEFGGTEQMKLEDVPLPKPGGGQALVRLKAAGLNFIDIYQRNGRYKVGLPFTPGLEGAGVVEAVGEGVSDVKVGDRVAYTGQPGGYAEASLVKADSLIKVPESLSWEQAAAFPLQGMTAHYLLFEYHQIKQGDTVLIHAAAGGMGLLLVQWAKHLGATVFGTVSTQAKADVAKAAGADHLILYTEKNFVDEIKRLTDGGGVDLIIDGVGKTTFAGNLEAARVRGTVVIYGAASGVADPIAPNALQQRSLTICGGSLFNYLLTRDELEMRAKAVLEGIEKGWLKLRIDRTLPLSQAAEAHRLLEGRDTMGKVILDTTK